MGVGGSWRGFAGGSEDEAIMGYTLLAINKKFKQVLRVMI
jgi:hypothetical protein